MPKQLVILGFILLAFQHSFSQKLTAKYKITDLPDIYLTQNQDLELIIDTSINLAISYFPKPSGILSIDNNTIKYQPDKDDLFPISVKISTPTNDTFSFNIVTQHFKEQFSSFSKYDVGSVLNSQNFYQIKVDSTDINNKHLIIEGKEIVFENSKSNPYYNLFYSKGEGEYPYKKVSIYTEKLIVKTIVRLPGAELFVKARDILFDAKYPTDQPHLAYSKLRPLFCKLKTYAKQRSTGAHVEHGCKLAAERVISKSIL